MLWVHLGLLVLHTVVVVPIGLGALVSSMTGTRDDERSYRGPRIAADGTWLMQTRETLSTEEATRTGMPARPYTDEKTGELKVPVAGVPGAGITDKAELAKLDTAAEKLQMPMKSADGLPLRGFLVPARSPPRFGAVWCTASSARVRFRRSARCRVWAARCCSSRTATTATAAARRRPSGPMRVATSPPRSPSYATGRRPRIGRSCSSG